MKIYLDKKGLVLERVVGSYYSGQYSIQNIKNSYYCMFWIFFSQYCTYFPPDITWEVGIKYEKQPFLELGQGLPLEQK